MKKKGSYPICNKCGYPLDDLVLQVCNSCHEEDSEYNNISVWDVTFYRLDDDGNELKDKNGKTIIYTSYKVDCSYLAEGLEVEDLVPEDKPNPYPYASIIEDKANEKD